MADLPDLASNSLAPSASSLGADRGFDLSLRLLTILVLIALAGSVGLLAYRWLAPRFSENDREPLSSQTNPPAPAVSPADSGPSHGEEVLMDPGRVFRCEEQGRVSFSDHACLGPALAPSAAPPSAPPPAPAAAAPASSHP